MENNTKPNALEYKPTTRNPVLTPLTAFCYTTNLKYFGDKTSLNNCGNDLTKFYQVL